MYNPNRFPSGYDELKTFYPIFYLDIFEMNELLKTYGRLTDSIEQSIDTVINNQLILRADEPTITKLESFLWLNSDKTKPLDERRRLVLSYFMGFGKMSASTIKQIVAIFTTAVCMVGFVGSRVEIRLLLGRDDVPLPLECVTLLLNKIPAHLGLGVSVDVASEYTSSTLYHANALSVSQSIPLDAPPPQTNIGGNVRRANAILLQGGMKIGG